MDNLISDDSLNVIRQRSSTLRDALKETDRDLTIPDLEGLLLEMNEDILRLAHQINQIDQRVPPKS